VARWDAELRSAIAGKRLLQCTYDTRSRIAEPHDYGLLHGVAKLLVYQIRGGRSPVPGWRLLEVSKIEELVVLEQTFRGSRRQAHQHHYQWDTLFARVE
jgi:hypothetical protein